MLHGNGVSAKKNAARMLPRHNVSVRNFAFLNFNLIHLMRYWFKSYILSTIIKSLWAPEGCLKALLLS
jgi:hypothetical protein